MTAPLIQTNLNYSIDAVGSRVTCNPAPIGTDQDWLVLVAESDYTPFCYDLLKSNFEFGGSHLDPLDLEEIPPHARFNSFTRGEDNIIVTASTDFHRRFLAASSVAKRLNLLNKDDRIALFQAVLYATIDEPCDLMQLLSSD